jgi:hypothetical protein
MKTKYNYLATLSAPYVKKDSVKFNNKYNIYGKHCMIKAIPKFINEDMVNKILCNLEILNKLEPNVNKFTLVIINNNRKEEIKETKHFANKNYKFNLIILSVAYFLNKYTENEERDWSSFTNFNSKFQNISVLHSIIDSIVHKTWLTTFLFYNFNSWREIVELFYINNLILSSGSNNIKSALSPNEANLKLVCLLLGVDTNESFRNTLEDSKKGQPLKDYTISQKLKFFKENTVTDEIKEGIKTSDYPINNFNSNNKANPDILNNNSENKINTNNNYKNNPFNQLTQKRNYYTSNIKNSLYFKNYSTVVNNDNNTSSNNLDFLINNYTNNNLFIILRETLLDNNLTTFQKQLEIEKILKEFWKDEIYAIFRNKNKLFKSKYGINIIINNILKLDQDLLSWKEDKRNFKGKKYKNLILSLDNEDIIYIVLSNVLPFCLKYDNIFNQNFQSLVEKIGKEVENNYYKKEWEKYNKKHLDENNKLLAELMFYSIKEQNYKSFIITQTEIINNSDINGEIFINNLSETQFKDKLYKIIGKLEDLDYYKLGLDLVMVISILSLLYKVDVIHTEHKRLMNIILPGPKLEKDLLKIVIHESDLLPMIQTPEAWVFEEQKLNESEDWTFIKIKDSNNNEEFISKYKEQVYGGFILNKDHQNKLLRESNKSIGKTRLNNLDLVKTVNYLSSIKYCVNNNVLNYILNSLKSNEKNILNLIKVDLHPETKNLFKLNVKKEFYKLNTILKHNSAYYNDNTVLQIALLFSEWTKNNNNCIYFPLFLEWRGRLYTDTGFFSYQKSELAKSLIMFKTGVILNERGLDSLKIYTANCYGKNKLSYNKRLEWVNLHIKEIISINSEFIFTADEPLLFLACCFELKGYYENPNEFISKLPIAKDATCNGLQHLSQMTNDTNLAKYVNIIKSNKEDLPEDIYQYMAKKLKEKIEIIKKEIKYSKLHYIDPNRKFIKSAIMTIPYGSTKRGIADKLKNEHFEFSKVINKKPYFTLINDAFKTIKTENEIANTKIYFSNSEINKLASVIHELLYDSFESLKLLVNYFKEMNKLLKKLNLSTIWLSPGGLIIEQKYVRYKNENLPSTVLGRRKSITIRKHIRDKINLRKQNEGIVANVTHSFDASNIAILIKELLKSNNEINIFTIHDCFSSNANDVELVTFYVKIAFLFLYLNKNFVQTYHEFILTYIKNSNYIINNDQIILKCNKIINIPKIPNFTIQRDFEENILGSRYFLN